MSESMHFGERLLQAVREVGNPACVGIDPHLDRLPAPLKAPLAGLRGPAWREAAAGAAQAFGLAVVELAAGRVPAVKPQVAFFEQLGAPGVAALEAVVSEARQAGLVVVLDAKRGDIGSTAEAYARATLDAEGPLDADAVTLSPYLGPESLAPFQARCALGKGLFVLLRTSNPGAGAWQAEGQPSPAARVAGWIEQANENFSSPGPVGAVVGATLPAGEGARWRARLPQAWFLVPGVGAQGAGVAEVRPLLRRDGTGVLVVSARQVLFPREGAREADWRAGIADRLAGLAQSLGDLVLR